MSTIHVVTEFKRDSKIESYWYECFHDEDFHGYNVNIIDGTLLDHESYLFSDTFFKSTQLRNLLDLVGRNKIRDGDVVVFANAWNYIAIPLSLFRDEFQMKFHMIGMWGDSLYNQESPMWHRYHGIRKDWARQVELSLFNAFDVNCFWCERHLTMFKQKFLSRKDNMGSSRVTGYPFGYLAKESKVSDKKLLTLVFPYNLRIDAHAALIQGLKTDLKEYEVVLAQEQTNNRLAYNDLLDEAKLMCSFNKTEINPVLLYEAMLRGALPLVPDTETYAEMFDRRFLYPSELAIAKNNKVMYLHRSRHQMEQIITDAMNRYDELLPASLENAEELGKYYSNKPFLKLLDELSDKKPKRAVKQKKAEKRIKKRNLTQY